MNLINTIKQTLALRSQREKVFLIGAVLFIGLALVFTGVVQPLHRARTSKITALHHKQATLYHLQQQFNQLQPGMGQPKSAVGNLLKVTASQLRAAHLTASTLEQTPNGQVNLSFNTVAFDELSEWLISLWQAYGVSVSQASLSSQKEPGLVNGSLSLALPNQHH